MWREVNPITRFCIRSALGLIVFIDQRLAVTLGSPAVTGLRGLSCRLLAHPFERDSVQFAPSTSRGMLIRPAPGTCPRGPAFSFDRLEIETGPSKAQK